MPTWGGILTEINQALASGSATACDEVRRRYLAATYGLTGHDTVLYATAWTQGKGGVDPQAISISDEDLQGLMEVFHGLSGDTLDLIIHSPGGSIEAADGFVQYMRSKFKHVRAIIPSLAMSAATMIACACDEIVMGKHSFLGPIDPQVILKTDLGVRSVAAQAIIEQFAKAQADCADTAKMPAWLPMLGQYGPDLLVACDHVSELSRRLVARWLESYMFAGDPNGPQTADHIASKLAKHEDHLTHGRHLSRETLEGMGMKIVHLEDDPDLQDAFLSVFHATTHTFTMTSALKIIENQNGKAFIKQGQVVVPMGPCVMMPGPMVPGPMMPGPGSKPGPADSPEPEPSDS